MPLGGKFVGPLSIFMKMRRAFKNPLELRIAAFYLKNLFHEHGQSHSEITA
jgi:hypothetical protein